MDVPIYTGDATDTVETQEEASLNLQTPRHSPTDCPKHTVHSDTNRT
jgi:hypothetical protein